MFNKNVCTKYSLLKMLISPSKKQVSEPKDAVKKSLSRDPPRCKANLSLKKLKLGSQKIA